MTDQVRRQGPTVAIRRIELLYLRPRDARPERSAEDPSHLVAITASVDGIRQTVVRRGFRGNRTGRLAQVHRRWLEDAATRACTWTLDASDGDLDASVTSRWKQLRQDLLREHHRSAPGLHRIRAAASNLRRRHLLGQGLETLRAGLDDLATLLSERRAVAEPGHVIVDGESVPLDAPAYLTRYFRVIDDYRCVPLPIRPVLLGQQINEFDDLEHLRHLGKNGTKGYLYYYYALGFGLRTRRLSKGSLIASDRTGRSMLFSWSTSQLSSVTAHSLCVNKEATRHLLASAGLPVPRGRSLGQNSLEPALRYAEEIGYPVVTKPVNGSRGEGVVVNIRDADELASALRALRRSLYRDSDLIVERYLPGRDYRIVVVADEVRGALLRVPASVTGDGRRTTLELMLAKHAWRMRNPHFLDRSAFIDEEAAFGTIHGQEVDLTRIPAEGEVVAFGTSCNLSQGADSVDVLDELHPSIRAAAIEAVRTIPGLRYCGVDMLLEDHTRSLAEQSAGIIELNAKAAIGNCEYPMFGASREVVRHVFSELAEDLGIELRPLSTGVHRIACDIRGYLGGARYLHWLRGIAKDLGVELKVRSQRRRQLSITVTGNLTPVAMLTTRLIIGPRRSRPTSVRVNEVEPLDPPADEPSRATSRLGSVAGRA